MASHFCFSVRFLGAAFHGRVDGDAREWPPSPMRLFQALVATAARSEGGRVRGAAKSALEWLESRSESPVVIAPANQAATSYQLSVPNNALDVVARAWVRGNYSNSGDANPAVHRTMKLVAGSVLDGEATHYLWTLPEPIDDEVLSHAEVLSRMAGSIVALGWGLDLVVGHAEILLDEAVEQLQGERWLPSDIEGQNMLRVPVRGSLKNAVDRHERFVQRLTKDGLVPPPPLTAFRRVEYRQATNVVPRQVAVFSLLEVDGSRLRPFDPARSGLTVAGMTRSAVKSSALRSGWPDAKIAEFLLGHGELHGAESHKAVGPHRFAYLPLPSIETRSPSGVWAGSIRRVLLSVPAGGCEEEIAWARRALSGEELREENTGKVKALLSMIPENQGVVQRYLGEAAEWATVTPVVLPGYDDPRHYRRRLEQKIDAEEQRDLIRRLESRIEGLLRKAILQAGYSEQLANSAELDWRKTGFWPGVDLADRYGVPDHLKRFPRYHVKVSWRNAQGESIKIRGPICLGGGRYYGVGLFARL